MAMLVRAMQFLQFSDVGLLEKPAAAGFTGKAGDPVALDANGRVTAMIADSANTTESDANTEYAGVLVNDVTNLDVDTLLMISPQRRFAIRVTNAAYSRELVPTQAMCGGGLCTIARFENDATGVNAPSNSIYAVVSDNHASGMVNIVEIFDDYAIVEVKDTFCQT